MEKMKKVVKGTGKVFLALLTGILMPILIWVAMGVALNRKMREKAVQRKTAPEFDGTLAATQAAAQEKKH